MINLHKNDKFDTNCLNIKVDVTFANENYFRTKFKNVSICIITISIIIRELKVTKHTVKITLLATYRVTHRSYKRIIDIVK